MDTQKFVGVELNLSTNRQAAVSVVCTFQRSTLICLEVRYKAFGYIKGLRYGLENLEVYCIFSFVNQCCIYVKSLLSVSLFSVFDSSKYLQLKYLRF